jgi:prevent-host-death family protein
MAIVHGILLSVKMIAAGSFKQTCLRLLDEVAETGETVLITKRGRPVAQLTPVPADTRNDWAGAMRGTGRILGDLVAPALKPGDWAAESE